MRSLRRRFSILLLLLPLAVLAADAQWFDIPAQSLPKALKLFASQANMQLLYESEVVSGGNSNTLVGEYDKRMALEHLLKGTGYEVVFTKANGATIRAKGAAPSASRVTGGDEGLRLAQAEASSSTASQDENVRGKDEDKKYGAQANPQEIVVTAQKRTERVQDVPSSIAVVTAEDISQRGLVDAEDYLRGIPGVNQVGGAGAYGGQLIVIRGMETGLRPQNFYAGPTTATYFGETPTSTAGGLVASNVDIKLVDIERVEVLRGPQGTAFGSSSMGGAVRTIPVAPKLDRREGKLAAAYSSTSGTGGDNYMFQGIANVPLIADKLAIRATAYAFSDSGFYRNRAGSDPAYQAGLVSRFGAQAFAVDEENEGSYYATGGRLAALYQATEDLRVTLSYLTQKNETDGWPLATSGTYDQTLMRVAPEHVFRGQTSGVLDSKIDIANAVIEYDLSWADLLATYSFIDSGQTHATPYGVFNNIWSASMSRVLPHREQSAEIRLVTRLDDNWNFLAGVYAEKQFDSQRQELYWVGDPATNVLVPGARFFSGSFIRRDRDQQAAFGEVSWKFLSNWTLTGGARAFQYSRIQRSDNYGPLIAGGFSSQRDAGEASGAIFRANLSYKPAENALLYAGWSQGFRPGQIQPPPAAGLCDVDGNGIIDGTNFPLDAFVLIKSDEVNNYEVGGKVALLDRRLAVDAAVFRMDWSDIPVSDLLPCGGGYTVNAGGARSEGVEIQANLQLTDALRADIGGSWVDARLTKDVPAQGYHSGDRLPGAPKTNANVGLHYAFKLGEHNAFVRADGIYVGPFYTNVLQSPGVRAGDYVKLDATARVAFDTNLDVDLYIRNLTNEDAFTLRGSSNLGPFYGHRMQPRTIGLQLNYSF